MTSIENLYSLFKNSTGVSTDTRKNTKGNIFFALKGENFNANEFAIDALNHGASHAVVDDVQFAKDDRFILVEDVLKTLQQLANYHRRQFQIPFIGITGTNGKTTTKELTYQVLKSKFKTQATSGNLNNHIGVPLTLLEIKPDTEFAIIEMGANHVGEIAALCEIAEPTHGIITNIGKAHLEGFGGYEGVIKAKSELYRYLEKRNGCVFINSDDELLLELVEGISKIIRYGKTAYNFCSGEIISNDSFLSLRVSDEKQTAEINSQIAGSYNFDNILCAACVGFHFGVSAPEIKSAIENYVPSNNRSQILQRDSNTFIMDAYNANPSSMKAALENFQSMKGNIKIPILGDMFELGDDSAKEHQAVVDLLPQMRFAKIILVGPQFAETHSSLEILHFKTTEELKAWFAQQKISNTTFLVKGSRKMGLERGLSV